MTAALKRRWRVALVLLLSSAAVALLLARSQAAAQRDPSPPPFIPAADSPLARHEHPRLFVTARDLPALREKLSRTVAPEFRTFVEFLDRAYDRPTAGRTGPNDVINFAFLYLIDPRSVPGVTARHTKAEYGAHAKALLLEGVSQHKASPDAPIAYDWLFDLLNPSERAAVITHLTSAYREPDPKRDNPFDDQPMGWRTTFVTAGLAFYGDLAGDGEPNAGNAEAERRVSRYASWIDGATTSDLVAGNFVAGDDGGWSQGLDYASKPETALLLRTLEAYRTAAGLSKAEVYGHAAVYRYLPQWLTYMLLPQGDGRMWRPHSTVAAPTLQRYGFLSLVLGELRVYAGVDDRTAGLAQWLLDTQGAAIGKSDNNAREQYLFGHFLMGQPVPPQTPDALQLPLTKRFASYGAVFMRTHWGRDWVNPADTVIAFVAATWNRSTTYWQWQNPSFTIDRRGPLVIHSGTQGHQDYQSRSWAGNTIIFPDPDEAVARNADMGGQRRSFPNVLDIAVLTPGGQYDVGGIKRFLPYVAGDSQRAFDYVYADVTRTYNGPANHDTVNTQKVVRFVRQFVYFRPARQGATDRVVVFDRTETTSPKYEPRWIFHPSREPNIGGTMRPNWPVRGGSGEGKTTYEGADNGRIEVVNDRDGSAGRLWVTSLLPEARQTIKVGGPGHEFEDPYGAQVRERGGYKDDIAQSVGQYRVEFVPAARSATNEFLVTFEAGDQNSSATRVVLLRGTNLTGVRIGDRIAAFATLASTPYRDGVEARLKDGSLTIDGTGACDVLIADLQPGASYIVDTSGSQSRVTASDAGTVYLRLDAPAGSALRIHAEP